MYGSPFVLRAYIYSLVVLRAAQCILGTHTLPPSGSLLISFPSRLVLASNSLLVVLIVWFLLLQLSSSFFVKYYSNLLQVRHRNDEFCRSVFRAAHPFPSMKGSGYDDDDCAM